MKIFIFMFFVAFIFIPVCDVCEAKKKTIASVVAQALEFCERQAITEPRGGITSF